VHHSKFGGSTSVWRRSKRDADTSASPLIAFDDVYGDPPLSKDTPQHLDAAYAALAEKEVACSFAGPVFD
jgi:hypothetical protein